MRTTWPTLVKGLVASLALLFFQPLAAAAGTITFLDTTDGVTETFGGDAIGRVSELGGCSGTSEVCIVGLAAPQGSTGASFNSTNILEPGSGQLSDTILVEVRADPPFLNLRITFTSDSESGSPSTQVASPFITETGADQFASTITWLPGGATDDIRFQSDVENVPEPTTLLLWGTTAVGLVGLACWRRRRQELAAAA